MSVGSKIKALRLQRGMTQNELAGDAITRGMLSRIEGGSANPSMQTLAFLAARLEVPPSFLLEDTSDLLPAERARFAKAINEEFRVGNLHACLDLFSLSSFSTEAEFAGIYAHTAFTIAIEAFNAGEFAKAKELLCQVSAILPQLPILPPSVSEKRIAFLYTVMDNISDPDAVIAQMDTPIDFGFQPSLFFSLLKLLREGRDAECETLIEFSNPDRQYRDYLVSQIRIKEYKFIDALLSMKALPSDESCPYFLALLCYRSMENCCKLCEDYKGAYENHLKYQTLLEKSNIHV